MHLQINSHASGTFRLEDFHLQQEGERGAEEEEVLVSEEKNLLLVGMDESWVDLFVVEGEKVPEVNTEALASLELDWTLMIPDENCVEVEMQEERNYYGWWATTAALPAAAVTLGTVQQIAGNTTRF